VTRLDLWGVEVVTVQCASCPLLERLVLPKACSQGSLAGCLSLRFLTGGEGVLWDRIVLSGAEWRFMAMRVSVIGRGPLPSRRQRGRILSELGAVQQGETCPMVPC
jgi:hypothetical protein